MRNKSHCICVKEIIGISRKGWSYVPNKARGPWKSQLISIASPEETILVPLEQRSGAGSISRGLVEHAGGPVQQHARDR